MGLTGVADGTDPTNVFYNPANVLSTTGIYFNGAYRSVPSPFTDDLWFASMNVGGGYRIPDETDFYSFGIDVSGAQFDYGESIATDTEGNPLGEFHSKENYISVAAGAAVSLATDYRLAAGVAVKRWWADYAPASTYSDGDPVELNATAFDLGTTFAIDFYSSDWRITPAVGFAYLSEGKDFDTGNGNTDPLPAHVSAGLSVQFEGPSTEISNTNVPVIAFTQNIDWTEWLHGDRTTFGIGLEVAAYQIGFLRLGYFSDDEMDWSQSTFGLGIGIPSDWVQFRFDYARYPIYGDYGLSSQSNPGMYNLSLIWPLS